MAFLYTREAHPGEHYPAHRDFAHKLEHARAFARDFGIRRPILVDGWDGPVHRAYGLLPNMTYIIGTHGRVLYRADWTDAESIRAALDYLLGEGRARRAGIRPAPFYSELLGYRPIDRAGFMEGLERAGSKAVAEFIAAVEHTSGPQAARPLREWQAARAGGSGGVKLPEGNL